MDTLAATISAVGTVVAIFTSLFLLMQGQRDRRMVASDRRQEQAAQVTTWAEWNYDWPDALYEQSKCPVVRLRNASNAAVYEAFVDITSPVDGQTLRVDIGAVPPGHTTDWNFTQRFSMKNWVPDALSPRLYFRDARGQRWKRNALGILGVDHSPGHDEPFQDVPRGG